jgi:acetyl-CoA decarbonylase/synthase complex subunit gamma
MAISLVGVPRSTPITSEWSARDTWGAVRARVGNFRMGYRVEPGLYALGSPDMASPVYASANYKLSFDILRRALKGAACWILVLDTKAINVWCAAGKGTFGTEELVERIQKSRLDEVVRHRFIVLPQLGASGVQAHLVEKQTGFRVRFGPVDAKDIPAYIAAGFKATPAMRQVRFSLRDRLILAPMELSQSLMRYPAFVLAAFLLAGVGPRGVIFGEAWSGGWPLFLLGLGSVLAGSFLAPILLPLIPVRSFSAKGWILGAAVNGALLHGAGLAAGMDPFLLTACWLFFPAASAFMTLNFTGSTTFTSPSGVRKEIRFSLLFFIAALALAAAGLVLWKLRQWSLL